jgi:hypothetical protein
MDPKKLAALAQQQGGGPMPGKGGGKPPGGKGGGPQPPKGGKGPGGNPHQETHPGMPEDEETTADEGAELPEELKPFAPAVKLLERDAEDVEEQCEGIDEALLSDAAGEPDDEQKAELEDSLGALSDDLVGAMKGCMKSISQEDAMGIATHLEDEGFISDAEQVGAYLFHLGQVLAAAPEHGDEEHGDDGGGDGGEDDEDDYGDE